MEILECRSIKEEEYNRIKREIDSSLQLAVIQIGRFQENELYLRNKSLLAEKLGIQVLSLSFDEDSTKEEIIEKIKELNKNPLITGIMIQKPILSKFSYQELLNYISPKKDVDGLTEENKKKWALGSGLVPCTARSVLKILEVYKILVENKEIVILGKSDLAGKPLYEILKEKNKVVLCDSKTEEIKTIIKKADIVITAIGKPHYLTKGYFKDGQVIIDVGTSYLNGKLVGDVNIETLESLDVKVTKVPGGVGQLTPIFLFDNLLLAHKRM